MIVRKIHQDEYKRVRQLCSLAFEYVDKGIELPAVEMLRHLKANPSRRQQIYWDSNWAAFEDDNKTMMATMTLVPYCAQFDGHEMDMIGIGGVATLPQYRRSGCIRKCFEKALPDMYERGAAFSYLYPFSTAFYRKFGYELGCERNLYKLELAGMPAFEVDGSYHLLEAGTDLKDDIKQIHHAFEKRYNMMIIDEEIEYKWIDDYDPFVQREYTYVYRSADGTPKAVVTYKPVVDDGDRTLDCDKGLYFSDMEGLKAVITLLKRLQADHSHILISLPADVELGGILPEWSFNYIQCKRMANGMVRVINAEKALQMAKMRGTGELTIDLRDEHIPQNNGRFHVVFENGTTTLVERTEEAADMVLTIQDFSRLLCGRYDVSDLVWLPDVQLNCPPEKAAQVFYRKPMHITRYF